MLTFKKLQLEGVKTLVDWAQAEGWNPGPNDAQAFYETDPEGFIGFYKNDALIGGGSVVAYGQNFGFMGFFIMKPEYRGTGLGRQLWYHRRDYLLSRLNKNATIGMDGVVAMQSFYKKGGFSIVFKDERHECIGKKFTIDEHISSILPKDFQQIRAYDAQCFGFDRWQFLQHWLALPQLISFKYVVDGQLKGFALLRKAAVGFKVCPLFADNAHVAEALYQACLNAAIGQPVYLDIPANNADAVDLAKRYNTKYVFECARMYYGTPMQLPIHKIFGITTFELG